MTAWQRMVRTAVQLVAAGALTELVRLLASDAGQYGAYVFAGNALIVTFAQNYAEDAGWIPALMKR